jgi:hypothetical protein
VLHLFPMWLLPPLWGEPFLDPAAPLEFRKKEKETGYTYNSMHTHKRTHTWKERGSRWKGGDGGEGRRNASPPSFFLSCST